MNLLRQIASVTGLNLKNLPSRMGPSLVVVAGMGAAIGVLVSILSLATGFAELQRRTGDPGRAIILSQTADTEGMSAMPRTVLGDIVAAPGIARDAGGASLADPEYVNIFLVNRRTEGNTLLTLRGMGTKANTERFEYEEGASVRSMGGRDMLSSSRAGSSSAGTTLSRTSICGGKKDWVKSSVLTLARGNRPAGGNA